MIETSWKLKATTQAEMIVGGVTLKNVVLSVHWRCFATDSATGASLSIYGEQPVPAPETPEGFIDVSVLAGMKEQERRDTVLGWAEAIAPGFVAETEAQVIAALEAELAEPPKATLPIL